MHIPLKKKLTLIRAVLACLLALVCRVLGFSWLQSLGLIGLLFLSGTEVFKTLFKPAYSGYFVPYRVRITLDLKLMLNDAGLITDRLSFEQIVENSPGLKSYIEALDFSVVSKHRRELFYWNSFHKFSTNVSASETIYGLVLTSDEIMPSYPDIFLRAGREGYDIGLSIPDGYVDSSRIDHLRGTGIDRNTFNFAVIPYALFRHYYHRTDDESEKSLNTYESSRQMRISIAESNGWKVEDRFRRHRYATLYDTEI